MDIPENGAHSPKEKTLHKDAGNALGKAQEIFRLLVDAVEDYAIFAMDRNGIILSWNHGAERLKGYTAKEIIGQHFSKFYTKIDIDRNHPAFELKEAFEKGKYEEEGWRIRKDGKRFWANVVINKLMDEHGNFLGYSKITRDLTERKAAEESLKESEERFRLLVTNVFDYGILTLDPKGYITTWNLGAERIKGYKAHEILGSHFSKFYTQEDIDNGKPEMELRTAEAEGKYEEEGWRVRKDGTLFWANVVISALFDEKGSLKGFAKITRDLTARKRADEALKKNEEKLMELNENLEKKVAARTQELTLLMQALEQAVRVRENFLSITSHELKTPLTSLKLRNQMRLRLIEKNGDKLYSKEEIKAMAEDEEVQINRLIRLVDDILDTTRIDAGKLGLQLENVELGSLINQVLLSYTPQLQVIGCEISFQADSLIHGHWDIYRIEQVFTNLLTNAIRYGEGKPIEITLTTKNDRAILSVRDHGIGISKENQERIFEKFERATNMNESKGLGLGLYIVKQIVESHNGSIELISAPNEGSTFIISLPLN